MPHFVLILAANSTKHICSPSVSIYLIKNHSLSPWEFVSFLNITFLLITLLLKGLRHKKLKNCLAMKCLMNGWRSCAKGLRQKVWTRTKISNPNIRYFIKIKYKNLSQFLYFSEDFGQKNALFGQKQCF